MQANGRSRNHIRRAWPIKARQSHWAQAWALSLARRGVSPNAISAGSVVFGMLAGACFVATRFVNVWWGDAILLLAAIVGIQGRLICNLLDGMVAVEGGKGSKSGEIFNDFPDRLADPIIIVCVGYAVGEPYGPMLGWLAALLAVMTAYVRVLGRSIGSGIYFIGPMAKQHRMALLTVACILGAIACRMMWQRYVLLAALVVMVVGCVVTVIRRLRFIVKDLESK